MNYIRAEVPYIETPIGLDAIIQNLQLNLAFLPWLERSYGRATVAEEKDTTGKTVFIPEVYAGQGEYLRLYPNNYLSSHCFFKVEGPARLMNWAPALNNEFVNDISIIFWGNLETIQAELQLSHKHRFTENLKNDINVLIKQLPAFRLTQIFETPREVYRGFSLNHEERQTFKHPEFGFRYFGQVFYRENCRDGFHAENNTVERGGRLIANEGGFVLV